MLIVGELINTSRIINGSRVVEDAVMRRDAAWISELARSQVAAGADYLDINAGTLRDGEAPALVWLTQVVQDAVPVAISFDSPDPVTLSCALSVYNGSHGTPLINSITAEVERFARVLPLVLAYGANVVALALDDTGIQRDPEQRQRVARGLIERLLSSGVPPARIYLDPLTLPICIGDDVAVTMLEMITHVNSEFPGVHTIAGLSNISHGMPSRKRLNQAMMLLALGNGLDAAILDPLDGDLMTLIDAAELLLGRDAGGTRYISKSRCGAPLHSK